MNPFISAVNDVGREVWLIKDNRIVGEGRTAVLNDGIISVQMCDDRAKALVANSASVLAFAEFGPEKQYRWSYFQFCRFTGAYLDDDERFCETLEDVRVVDKFNLRFGIVPDSFKEVPEFREAVRDVKDGVDIAST